MINCKNISSSNTCLHDEYRLTSLFVEILSEEISGKNKVSIKSSPQAGHFKLVEGDSRQVQVESQILLSSEQEKNIYFSVTHQNTQIHGNS